MKHIKLEKNGYKAYIIVDKQEKLNAFDTAMYKDVGKCLDDVAQDPDIRVVILKGAGRAFSAGYDVEEEAARIGYMEELAEIEDYCNSNSWKIWNMRKPVIAQIHGYCLGGACELVLPCDYVLSSDDCKVGEPEITFGAMTAYNIMPWLVPMRQAKALMLTGEKITGKRAAEIGLVTASYPADQLEQEVEALADKLIRIAPPVLCLQKKMLNRTYEIMGMQGAIDWSADLSVFARAIETEEVVKFNEIVSTEGMKAAFRWQEEYFDNK